MCVVFCNKWEVVNVLMVVQIWVSVLLLDCFGFANCGKV